MLYCKVIDLGDRNSSIVSESLKREGVYPIIHIFNRTYHIDFIFNDDFNSKVFYYFYIYTVLYIFNDQYNSNII